MFRQITVYERDRKLQCIVWRSNPEESIQSFMLNTVTYGTACAPYLAIRCLRQLAATYKEELPHAAKAIEEDCYMDDMLSGAKDIQEARKLQSQLTKLLKQGQFQLRKWRSNHAKILEELSEDSKTDELLVIDKEGAMKTLSIFWDATTDQLHYKVEMSITPIVTKRIVLSRISQVFDLLGLLASFLITGKLIMQQLWTQDIEWDSPLPEDIFTAWERYYTSLPRIKDLHIPRNAVPETEHGQFELLGFSDASEKAYGACIYAISRKKNSKMHAHLICAKSRVAPLKKQSLPRLELEGALLLTRLYETTRRAFGEFPR